MLTALVLVLGVTLGAAAAAGEQGRLPALFQDQAEVNIVNVEVFVQNNAGQPISGLSQGDFELLVDGEPIEIRHFHAIEGGRNVTAIANETNPANGANPAEANAAEKSAAWKQDQRWVIFVDNESISALGRKKLFERLREFVLENRRDDVHMMLLSRERSTSGRPLVVRQGFTQTPHEIFVALDELEKTSTGTDRLDVERRNLVHAIEGLEVDRGNNFNAVRENPDVLRARAETEARALLPRIYAFATQRYEQAQQSLATLTRVVDMLASIPGRKALVYVSDGLPLKAGEGLIEGWASRVEGLTRLAGETSVQSEAARFDATRAVTDLVGRANAARLTFYALSGSPPAPLRRGAAESRASFSTNSLASIEEANGQGSLRLMAENTGGRAGLTNSTLKATLAGIATDFDHYYSLGFVADTGEGDTVDGAARSIEVAVRSPEATAVRWRRSFQASNPQRLASQRLLASLVLGEVPENPLGILSGTPKIAPAEDGNFAVSLLVQVPLAELVLVPNKSEHSARLSLYVAARDDSGRTSEVTRSLCPVRIPNSEVLLALGRTMVCGVRLLMRGGPQEVAVAVRDETADTVSIVRFALDVGAKP